MKIKIISHVIYLTDICLQAQTRKGCNIARLKEREKIPEKVIKRSIEIIRKKKNPSIIQDDQLIISINKEK